MTTPERLRAAACLVALQHDECSDGSRAVLAAALDMLADVLLDESIAWYLRGLADGLRKRSPARRVRAQESN